ncbi:MAG: hypothetical protein ACE5ER_07035 [Nitrospinaceae bacterium]
MFYEVKVKNPDGTLKKVISPKKLNRMYWRNFEDAEDRIGLITTGQKPVPVWVKKSLDLMYPETFEINYY